jgi:hypothetical protein
MQPIRRLAHLLARLLPCALLASCASSPYGTTNRDAARHMRAMLENWKGRPVAEAIGLWGTPDAIRREGDLEVLQWTAANEKPDAYTEGWTEPYPLLCTREFRVDAAQVIRAAHWLGIECSHFPGHYAPPGMRREEDFRDTAGEKLLEAFKQPGPP